MLLQVAVNGKMVGYLDKRFKMKKLLIILSAVFVAACSDGEIGGYTESIIKGANAPESNASLEQQPSLLKKSSSPLDEDLSGLDEEELREKLMNSYPWPKPEGVAAPSSSSGSGESSGSSQNILEGSLPMPHNPIYLRAEEIQTFDWRNVNATFAEDTQHKYGFDQDPKGKDPNIYISTKENEGIRVMPYFSSIAYDNFYLHDESSNTVDFGGKDPQLFKDKPTQLSDKKTTYVLYGCRKIPLRRQPSPSCYNLRKKIHVLPYTLKTKNIVYTQIDGDGWNSQDSECNKGFNETCVTDIFNKIYNQAVVNVNIAEKGSQKDYKLDGLIEVSMNNQEENKYVLKDLLEKTVDKINKSGALEKDEFGKYKNTDNPYWHIVFAVNKVRKKWDLSKCISSTYDLSSCKKFHPEDEPANTEYRLYNKDNGPNPKTDPIVEIKMIQTLNSLDEVVMHYYIEKKGNPFPYQYSPKEVLYTDNGYPVIPYPKEPSGLVGAVSIPLDKKFNKNLELFDDYLPYGSIIFVPRKAGKTGYYMLMHELGHSFGLTDVAKSYVFKFIEDDRERGSFYLNKYGNMGKGNRKYENFYASSETNLMSWQTPNGIKLRYRPSQMVCTGGTVYYKKSLNVVLDGGRIKKEFDQTQGTYGAVERVVKIKNDKNERVLGYEINQWECIRGNCYDQDFSSSDDLIKKARKEFIIPTDWCYSNESPTDDQAKNIVSNTTAGSDYKNKRDRNNKAITIEEKDLTLK